MLEVRDLNAYYGKGHIVQGISFDVVEGEVLGILGRNGVGKTTVLRCLLGLAPPRKTGSIRFCDRDISTLSAHKIAGLGLGYVPRAGVFSRV